MVFLQRTWYDSLNDINIHVTKQKLMKKLFQLVKEMHVTSLVTTTCRAE